MGDRPSAENRYLGAHVLLMNESLRRWTGRSLPGVGRDIERVPKDVFEAPYAIVSHGTERDPVFNYGNRTALNLFEVSWDELLSLPSRLSAEPDEREARRALMDEVSRLGFAEGYEGVRISALGRRFRIRGATVWNLIDKAESYCGQAALFSKWHYL